MAFAFHSQIFAIYIRTDAFRGILFVSNDVVQNGSSFYATQMTMVNSAAVSMSQPNTPCLDQ